MGNRLSKIVTRTGDDGTTALSSGHRVCKGSLRIEVMGTVDELNSFVGSFIESVKSISLLIDIYSKIQNDLFDLGGELSMPGHQMIQSAHWQSLEAHIEVLNKDLPPLKNFILPGGSEPLARCHIVRTVARRAERSMVALAVDESINPASLVYCNRLSDLAFVTARWLANTQGEPEVLWQPSSVVKAED